MRRELDRCDRDCIHFVETDFTPTRLLDLDADNGIQLIETNTKFPHKAPQYAALRYCWGSASDAAAGLVTGKLSLSTLSRRDDDGDSEIERDHGSNRTQYGRSTGA
jgi:hypothetical protein